MKNEQPQAIIVASPNPIVAICAEKNVSPGAI